MILVIFVQQDGCDSMVDVSVVLTVYNGEKYLPAAIESVLQQSYKDFELIALDDGSTDGSLRILQEFATRDTRVRVFSRENKGVARSLVEAMGHARGKLVARMDADDISYPDRLASQCAFFSQHPDAVAIGGAAQMIDKDGSPICQYFPHQEDASLRSMLPVSPFVSPSVMFKRDAYNKVGGYPEKMKWGGEDVILYGKLARVGNIYNMPNVLVQYRLVPGSLSRKSAGFRRILSDLILQELSGRPIDDAQLLVLQEAFVQISAHQAHHDYLFEIARLCLWSGSNRPRAVRHLLQCMACRNLALKAFLLLVLALLPQFLVRNVYSLVKHRRYRPC